MAAGSAVTILLLAALVAGAGAGGFTIVNMCPTMVYPAGLGLGLGWGLPPRDTMHFHVYGGGRIWGRTGCNFDADGRGHCETGDCAGQQYCNVSGTPPATLAEFSLGDELDYYDVSVVDGFNVPMFFGCHDDGAPAIRCMDPSCPDANHHADDGKIRTCIANSGFYLLFCPWP
uniref:Uncharacterized protein n=1 Tax=Avena sativa TaxID=4498 RepID=A0ACD5X2E7_AVESA